MKLKGKNKDGQLRAIHYKQEHPSKKTLLKRALNDADRRYEIGVGKMSEITRRVHELEVERNQALRKEFLLNEIKKNPHPELIKEFNKLQSNEKTPLTYQEVVQGYRSMSRRKNELEEERNYYVKEIENLKHVKSK